MMQIYEFWVLKKFGNSITFRFPPTSEKSKSKKKQVYLTIDDVPFTKRTSISQICDLLEFHKACASLFLLGKEISSFNKSDEKIILPLKHAASKGLVSFQNHGFDDLPHWKLSNQILELELLSCKRECKLRELHLGQWYRPGHGHVTETILRESKKQHLKVVLGDVYTLDPHISWVWFHFFLLKRKIQDGSVVILHERPWTIPLLEKLLPYLNLQGFEFKLLPEAEEKGKLKQ
jgi:peptidoglycan/xylan/chitin deacetylase (PgdA/CDA1 family)